MALALKNGTKIDQVEIDHTIYKAANDAHLSVPQYLNRTYGQSVDAASGTVFQQMCAQTGLVLPGKNVYGLRAPTVAEALEGTSMLAAASANTKSGSAPFGAESRTLFPAAIVSMIENELARDRTSDSIIFNDLVALDLSIGTENFEQPIIDYGTFGGPERAKAQRIAQLAEPVNLLTFKTSDKIRKLPVWSIGAEFSHQALRVSTLDIVALTMARYVEVEKDQRAYNYLSSIFVGDDDMNTGAIPAVTTVSLDPECPSGKITHKAWIKFLYRFKRYRHITHVIMDIDTYLKVEGRIGRPGVNEFDPSLARIDPQARVINDPFTDVKVYLVDSAAEGGPVPANTIWALDASKGIIRVTNTAAEYSASQEFAMRRSEAFRMDWSEDVYRMFPSSMKAFDVLTIV